MSKNELDELIYAGSDPQTDEEDLSGLGRGDEIKTEDEAPSEEGATPEPISKPEPEPTPEPQPEELRPDHRIPKHRFDEVNERRKAAERRLAELERQAALRDPQRVVDFDFDAKEEQYAQLVLDGDLEKAKGVRREIRTAEQAAFERLAVERASQAREQTKAEMEFTAVVQEINEKYPMFDPNREEYSQDLVDETIELHQGFLARGYTAAAAMKKAVQYVTKVNGLDAPPQALEAAPQQSKKPDVKKKLEAAAKQPPKQAGRGLQEETGVDLTSLTEEEFDALPESKLRELRGDARYS